MNLANLQAFVAIARSGSFSAAAEQLHLTQPAISKRIVALESELEVRLLDRLGRRVLPTEAGNVLLAYAGRVLGELDEARREIRDLSGDIRGHVRLATSHHIGLHRLPGVLQSFKRNYPQVRLDLRFHESEEASVAVSEGLLELAVVTLPLEPEPRLRVQPLWHDSLRVACSPDHPLLACAPLQADELARHPAILPGPETVTRQIIQCAFAGLGIELRVEMSTNYLETIRMMVEIGLGWSVLPLSLTDRLATPPVEGLAIERTLGVVLRRGRTLPNAARAMLATLAACADAPSARPGSGS